MSNGSAEGDASALENLSALSDGELEGAAVARACSAWRGDPSLRSAWHAYQLIGDVLRSEDLACRPAHDAAFVAAVRTRLAAEPVVLAPEATEPAPAHGVRARWTWKAPTAVAAGFVLVAGALVVTRSPSPTAAPAAAVVAAETPALVAAPALPPVALPTLAPAPAEPSFVSRRVAGDSKVLRDARLERYLAAHQQFAGTTALGVPSAFLRNAAAEAPNR